MKSHILKGYLYAFVATLAFSNVYIFSKAALNEVHLSQFGIYWFGISLLLNLLVVLKNKELSTIFNLDKKKLSILLLLGGMEIITTSLFFTAINIIHDPSITSFIGNMYPVILIIMGVVFLNERFGIIEVVGVVIAVIGAFIISYQGKSNIQSFFIPGTGIVLLNGLFAAATSIIVKKNIGRFSPEFISFNRTFWLFLFACVFFLYSGQSLTISGTALKNITIGAILGPFLSLLTIYLSFKYIEASRSSIIQCLKGIFVLIGTYLYMGTIPKDYQLVGGFLTIIGIIIMTLAQAKIIRIRESK